MGNGRTWVYESNPIALWPMSEGSPRLVNKTAQRDAPITIGHAHTSIGGPAHDRPRPHDRNGSNGPPNGIGRELDLRLCHRLYERGDVRHIGARHGVVT